MEDWWTTATIEPSIENHELSDIPRMTMSPSRHHNNLPTMHSSTMPLSKSSYNVLSAFCTEDNVPRCISYINQEMDSLGFSSACIEASSPEVSGGLNAVPALNGMYELLQMQRRSQRSLQEQEAESLKRSSALEHLQITNSRLKDQLELSKRETSGLHEAERQLQLKIKTLQNCLKTEKDEVQKLQSIIASRASQYSHDAKRKERESTKLKERLNQLLVEKRDKKLAIDVLNYLGRADGKRSQWKTGKVEARHEGEMYKSLLSDYEIRHRHLMLENVELKKVLQQMKREMVSILSPSPRKPCSSFRDHVEDSLELSTRSPLRDSTAGSDRDKEVGDGSRETLDQSCDHAREQSCEHAREQLTNSIRQQWRRLKSHMERLDSQECVVSSASLVQQSQQRAGKELVPRQIHEEEMERMRLEVQQCKDFIQTQQQLLQQQLNSPCYDDETAALLNDCYTLEEKERLKEEWRLFDEQRRNFERERENFTEAAIRLGHEKRAFEEDRASWLKNQFLNMTQFVDRKRHSASETQHALSTSSEPEMRIPSTPARLTKSRTYTVFSTPKAVAGMASTADLYHTLRLIPDSSSSSRGSSKRGSWQESNTIHSREDSQVRSRDRYGGGDCCSIFSLGSEENSLT
ncbi:afadin- and alpha-actinin-binding protein isoform X1 [Salmo salar]|uniref:Afadin- and alpha-actinin-binding protein isoform X1 n=1 Tax=Salmo salar TaxID=8030 RepID=A0A1S3LYK9_SALSA|nr:afadin- and alpha-actinin-binding protein isoform X1 [Salmo salar]